MTPAAKVDVELMAHALQLAERGLYTTTPNPRVGCVIAQGTLVIGEGWHERTGEAHAEVHALADAQARGNDPRGATAYVTLEPCNHHGRTPPCTEALLAAGIGRVVAAMRDPNPHAAHGADRLRAAGVAVSLGVGEAAARELNAGWIKRMQTGRPWLRLKIAASLDGRTALQNGGSQWITGAAARADGHHWRARACAILTGIGTVRQDDPRLTVRDVATTRQPLKVLIDRHAELPPTARLIAEGDTLIFSAVAPDGPPTERVKTRILPDRAGRIDLDAMLDALGALAINEVHAEAGAKLNGALLAAGIVDELLIYVAPCLLGDPARGMFDRMAPITDLADRLPLRIHSVVQIGDDWRIIARTAKGDA